ncbi:MAG: B12-binding domain-containing radical SAM protein [Acidaminobacteraceae bacterium]
MKIILKKARKKTPFTWINPIKVEPLELEYLKAVIDDLNLNSVIIDDLYNNEKIIGDIVVLNGYNTARNQMMREAKEIKEKSPETILIASGVDVQVNWKLYEDSDFDYIVFSNKLSVFKDLIEHIVFKKEILFNGILNLSLSLEKERIFADSEAMTTFEDIKPSRSYFDKIKDQTRYLLYDNVALVKHSHSCPHMCEFCFCKQLNKGHYVSRTYDDLLLEMESLVANYYWIVDDVFISNKVEARSFIETFKNKSFKMIVYLRADFIVNNLDLVKELKNAGIIEVIVGFESIKASVLEVFNKGYTPDINTKAITILKNADLSFTGLFMIDISYQYKDFKALKHYIKKHEIINYTFSIFTPLMGTDIYKLYEKDIIDFKCENYDFLHLVLKPLKMNALTFKIAFADLFVFQYFHSKFVRQFIYKILKDSFKGRFS